MKENGRDERSKLLWKNELGLKKLNRNTHTHTQKIGPRLTNFTKILEKNIRPIMMKGLYTRDIISQIF